MTSKKHVPLGKGLGALLGANIRTETVEHPIKNPSVEINIHQLMPGQYQPRGKIREEDLKDLADSIRAQGVLQPILIRKKSNDNYEIIAGERRWRAAKLAGLTTIPTILKEVPDENLMAIALIENIQRENLNALEEAYALERLTKEFGLTHQQVSESVGRPRTTITNLLRLLTLPEDIKQLLLDKSLEVGHAKILLGLRSDLQHQVANRIVAEGLSVRESERLVARLEETTRPQKSKKAHHIDPDVLRLQNSLSEKLGAFVEIQSAPQGKGKILIKYNSLDELEGILAHIV